tara:strand:+ start:160 stop:2118 length:1959 start_codon:yes stop_codon:yes gene_type:complete
MAVNTSMFVKIGANIKDFSSKMQNVQRTLGNVSKKMVNIGQTMTTSLTLPLSLLGAGAIKSASDFQEFQSKFNTIFSDIEQKANNTAQSLADSFGLSNSQALELLGNTGDLLTGFGFTQEEALKLSKQVNELSVDLASFTNFSGGASGASEALTKALLGERESIKSLGIAITEADLKRFAEEQGLVFKELDRVTKAQLTFDLALRQSQNAVGDYARTQESFANQTRKLKSDIGDLAVQFGEILLPAAQKIIKIASDLAKKLSDITPEAREKIVKFALIIGAGGPLLIAFGQMGKAINTLIIPALIRMSALCAVNPYIALAGVLGGALAIAITKARNRAFELNGELVKITTNAQELSDEALEDVISRFDLLSGSAMDLSNPNKGLENMQQNIRNLGIEKMLELRDAVKAIADLDPENFRASELLGMIVNALSNADTSAIKEVKDALVEVQKLGASPISPSVISPNLTAPTMTDPTTGMDIGSMAIDQIIKKGLEAEFVLLQMGKASKALALQLAQGAESFKEMGEMAKDAAKNVIDTAFAAASAIAVEKAVSGLPPTPFNLILLPALIGGALGMVKTAFNQITPFAEGGIVANGPVMGLVGEAGPEVIFPLSKLKSFMGEGMGGKVQVQGVISGNDIHLSNSRTINNLNRVGA